MASSRGDLARIRAPHRGESANRRIRRPSPPNESLSVACQGTASSEPGMPEHRPIRGHIPWTTVDATLRAARSIWLATARPDGRPMVAPLWYWRDSESTPPRLNFVTARQPIRSGTLSARAGSKRIGRRRRSRHPARAGTRRDRSRGARPGRRGVSVPVRELDPSADLVWLRPRVGVDDPTNPRLAIVVARGDPAA